MGFWTNRDPQCAQRVAALKTSLADGSTPRRMKRASWKRWMLGGVALLLVNPFSLCYFLVADVLGRIPQGSVHIYSRQPYQTAWFEYTDVLNHYHGGRGMPNVFPGSSFQYEPLVQPDWRVKGLTNSPAVGTQRVPVRLTATSPSPATSYPPRKKSKLTLDDWRKFSQALDPHLKITAMLGVMLLIIARLMRRRYVYKNDLGLSISDSPDSRLANANLLPWQCIKSIRVGAKKGIVLIQSDHGSIEYLRWPDIVACIEPGEFINALRTWASHAMHECKFPTEDTSLNKVDEHTYTKLWFKYYSTGTERQRAGQLSADEQLHAGRFKIVERLGSGGQGTAYLALDQSGLPPAGTEQHCRGDAVHRPAPQEVVLKEYILPVHRGEQVMEQSAKRLRLEADILQKIDHPNIVKLLDEFTEDHRGYLVMEYVRGTHLKALVAQEGPQPEATVRELALQICNILEYLHSMDPPIIHRDLTPDNLILQNDGIIKLVDFNVAHQLESVATATVVGKHAYIPPEQFRGKPTPQSDIYALGCTLHFLLTGQEPEPLTVSRPRLLNENVSEDLNRIIATCTNLDATKRFESVEKLREALLANDAPVTIKLSQRIEV